MEIQAAENETIFERSENGEAKSLVIFIHGVTGDSQTTWRNSKSDRSWPQMIAADTELGAVDTLSIGYQTSALGRSSNIEEIANRVANQLMDREIFSEYYRIAIIAHSMGGLIAKRVIRVVERDIPDSLQKIKTVIFFSTPAQGSSLSEIASEISNNPQFTDMLPSDGASFLQTLDNDWQAILRARTTGRPFPRVFCAYETQSTYGKMIVPRSSSQQGCDATPVAFDLNHAGIVKPVSKDDEIYIFARARIKQSFDEGLVRQNISIEILRSDGSLLKAGEYLRSGEQYSILLKAEQPAWFYVFVKDGSDIVKRYYPLGTTPNHSATKNLRIPDQSEFYITLDQVVGTETIFVFALMSRNDELANLASEVGFSTPTIQASIVSEKALSHEVIKRGGDLQRLKPNAQGKFVVPTYLNDAAAIYTLEHRE